MKKALLVTGASGFVGANAIKLLRQTNYFDWYSKIIATDLKEPDLDHPLHWTGSMENKEDIEFIRADITSQEGVSKIERKLSALESDYELYVWHMGGLFNYSASRELLYKVNVLGTKNILDMLFRCTFGDVRRNGISVKRFIFWSGGIVYGRFDHPKGVLPANENYPVSPENEYAWTKRVAEEWVMHFNELGVPGTIMRLAGIYGPYSRYGMGGAIILQARGELEPVIVGNGNNRTAMIHSEDVIRVAHFLGIRPEAQGEIYNVCDNTSITLGEQAMFLGKLLNSRPFEHFRMPQWVFRLLAKIVKRKAEFLGAKTIIDPALADIILLNSWMTNRKLMALAEKCGVENGLLKYGSTYEGLKQTIGWFKKEGWL